MNEARIKEISEKIKNSGVIAISNFLDSKKLKLIADILSEVKNESAKTSD